MYRNILSTFDYFISYFSTETIIKLVLNMNTTECYSSTMVAVLEEFDYICMYMYYIFGTMFILHMIFTIQNKLRIAVSFLKALSHHQLVD